jgi:hypothetical protein
MLSCYGTGGGWSFNLIIAIGGAVGAKKQDVSVAISLVVVWAVVMIFALPLVCRNLGLSTGVAGAWIGTSEFADAAGLAAAQAYGGYAGHVPGIAGRSEDAVAAFTLMKVIGRDRFSEHRAHHTLARVQVRGRTAVLRIHHRCLRQFGARFCAVHPSVRRFLESIRAMSASDARACRTCRHFEQRGAVLESMLPGLSVLSSAYGSVRAGDGLCTLRERYAAASSSCDLHNDAPRGQFAVAPRAFGTDLC